MKTAENLESVSIALHAMAKGERVMSATVRDSLVSGALGGSRPLLERLSERELQVLRLLGQGLQLGEIARELQLSVKTVGSYRERLKGKIGVDTARGLARRAGEFLRGNLTMDRSEDFSRSLTAINLHRIWWIIFITTLVNLAILGFNLLSPILHDYPLAAWQGVDALVSVALLVWISRLVKRRRGGVAPWSSPLPCSCSPSWMSITSLPVAALCPYGGLCAWCG